MRTVLITGPIGSGKSEVSAMLRSKGYEVLDCDSVCKNLYASTPGLKAEAEKVTGLTFNRLAEVFSNPEALHSLESLVYPLLLESISHWRQGAGQTAFIESATAASKREFDGVYDSVLLVTAPFEVRASRNPKVLSRDRFQNFDRLKADYTIENASTLEVLENKVNVFFS